MADPRTYQAPAARILSKEYALKRAAPINPDRANCTAGFTLDLNHPDVLAGGKRPFHTNPRADGASHP